MTIEMFFLLFKSVINLIFFIERQAADPNLIEALIRQKTHQFSDLSSSGIKDGALSEKNFGKMNCSCYEEGLKLCPCLKPFKVGNHCPCNKQQRDNELSSRTFYTGAMSVKRGWFLLLLLQ